VAERLARGQDPGLVPVSVSERLRDALLSLGPTGRTLLELGCGRGGLLLALIQAGAASIDAAAPDSFSDGRLTHPKTKGGGSPDHVQDGVGEA
jgi:hypothetical protein